ncbi:MAG: hypothetical protein IPP83_07195 [Flavobacteriales bacterium]|nr:hypothetical protein [Flavobacteriales bacterium]
MSALPKIAITDYITAGALKGLAKATIGVTAVSNVFGYVYLTFVEHVASQKLSVSIGLLLSLAIVVLFAKKEKGLRTAQYAVLVLVNTAILFHSCLGANTALTAVKERLDPAGPDAPPALQAGVLEGLKYLLLPTTPWINNKVPELIAVQEEVKQTKSEVASLNLDSTYVQMDWLRADQERNHETIKRLQKELASVGNAYQGAVEQQRVQVGTYEERLAGLERVIRQANGSAEVMQGLKELRTDVVDQGKLKQLMEDSLKASLAEHATRQKQQLEQIQKQQSQQHVQMLLQQEKQERYKVLKRRLYR